MARVPYLSEADLAPADRDMMARPINLFRALANSPGGMRRHYEFGEWIRWECELDPRLRELAILHVGYLTANAYEFSHHVEIGRRFGVTDADVDGLARFAAGEPSGLSELEDLVLAAARELTEDAGLAPSTWAALCERLPAPRVTELVIVVAFYNYVVRVLSGLDIDVEDEYLPYLDRFPLPDTRSGAPS
ncbi:carboxymuconolactone decarboxylase family protein [Jiangella asiatica]|uniref:Carboxymuconolactone decarboxylase family protein n=1 Tax=Jiangella asiatica TaxID=2530372 RepID=A0A4R5DDI0_9ACTN|nr:carboxymuconolactone decarboxylase family protein [Jiangella asiatica]TDE11819.1 carboxymuconolactone decarboxylase family protein [Jiangella asiatica]